VTNEKLYCAVLDRWASFHRRRHDVCWLSDQPCPACQADCPHCAGHGEYILWRWILHV